MPQAPALAEVLRAWDGAGLPPEPVFATFASELAVAGNVATVTREIDAGLETLEIDLPAVVTTEVLNGARRRTCHSRSPVWRSSATSSPSESGLAGWKWLTRLLVPTPALNAAV